MKKFYILGLLGALSNLGALWSSRKNKEYLGFSFFFFFSFSPHPTPTPEGFLTLFETVTLLDMGDFTEWCLPVFTLVCAKLLQSHPTLYDSVDCSPPGSLSVGFSRQEYWSGLPYPPPGDLPNPGIEPYIRDSLLRLLPWQTGSMPLAPPGEPIHFGMFFKISIILKMWPYQTEDDNLSCNWPGKKKFLLQV